MPYYWLQNQSPHSRSVRIVTRSTGPCVLYVHNHLRRVDFQPPILRRPRPPGRDVGDQVPQAGVCRAERTGLSWARELTAHLVHNSCQMCQTCLKLCLRTRLRIRKVSCPVVNRSLVSSFPALSLQLSAIRSNELPPSSSRFLDVRLSLVLQFLDK